MRTPRNSWLLTNKRSLTTHLTHMLLDTYRIWSISASSTPPSDLLFNVFLLACSLPQCFYYLHLIWWERQRGKCNIKATRIKYINSQAFENRCVLDAVSNDPAWLLLPLCRGWGERTLEKNSYMANKYEFTTHLTKIVTRNFCLASTNLSFRFS